MACFVAISAWLVQLAEYVLSKSDGKCTSHCCTRGVKVMLVTCERLERMSTRLQEMRHAVSD